MKEIGITSRPVLDGTPARLVLQLRDGQMRSLALESGQIVSIEVVSTDVRRCVGWYDIANHTNHPCEDQRTVDARFEACLDCRHRTGFNPAFYNAGSMSLAQATYNQQPHSVYVAYFGGGVAKVGIMSDSRGRERVFEQGALLYAFLGHYPNAMLARQVEVGLIAAGLKESVTKKMKQELLKQQFQESHELNAFARLLAKSAVEYEGGIISNLDHYFYGTRPDEPITPVDALAVSGRIVGVVGRYLVVENGGRLFGYWLSRTFGYEVVIGDDAQVIEADPLQSSLF